jgi:hypothetical protein
LAKKIICQFGLLKVYLAYSEHFAGRFSSDNDNNEGPTIEIAKSTLSGKRANLVSTTLHELAHFLEYAERKSLDGVKEVCKLGCSSKDTHERIGRFANFMKLGAWITMINWDKLGLFEVSKRM